MSPKRLNQVTGKYIARCMDVEEAPTKELDTPTRILKSMPLSSLWKRARRIWSKLPLSLRRQRTLFAAQRYSESGRADQFLHIKKMYYRLLAISVPEEYDPPKSLLCEMAKRKLHERSKLRRILLGIISMMKAIFKRIVR